MKKELSNDEKQVIYQKYLNREEQYRHHYYEEELKQYELMREGNPQAIKESKRMMLSNKTGRLSTSPLRHMQYLLVACTTLATRFAIEGGLDSESAYNISDHYIFQIDTCKTIDEVMQIHEKMISHFTKEMANLRTKNVFSKPIVQCMEYIDIHLHVPIELEDLANHVHLSKTYLSTLFKKETKISISDYILNRRISSAKSMLRYSNYSTSQISEILSFSTQSYFIKCFRKIEGMTPKEYQKMHYRKNFHFQDNVKKSSN